jgi:hypothetical protein
MNHRGTEDTEVDGMLDGIDGTGNLDGTGDLAPHHRSLLILLILSISSVLSVPLWFNTLTAQSGGAAG